jgi:hypothetical protein
MRTKTINFPDRQTLCVFPEVRSDLTQAVSELQLEDNHPVLVLIGGEIDEQHADATRRAIHTISKIAEDMSAVVICGGTEIGVMAEIGQSRWQNQYKFPLVGIALEELVTWTDGPDSTNFLWWGTKRYQLEPHCSHFILVPGSEFGDESAWVVDTATILSKGNRSVTILINGSEVSRKAIELSLKHERPVIIMSRTGSLADKLARQPIRHKLISVAPAIDEQRIIDLFQAALSVGEINVLTESLISTA